MPRAVFTVPNVITMGRFAAVPLVVHAILFGNWTLAFCAFLVAGLSDAVDGYIARHFNQRSILGAYLDPLADKALIVATTVGLAWLGNFPVWLAALIVVRDISIVVAVGMLNYRKKRLPVRPLRVSKWNTGFQLALVSWILGSNAFGVPETLLTNALLGAVVMLTVISAVGYGYMLYQYLQRGAGQVSAALDNADGY